MTLVYAETTTQQADSQPDSLELNIENSERRRGLRIRQARPVKVYDAAGARYFGGRTEDISATGLRIELPASADLRPREALNVHVGLKRGESVLATRRETLPARAVWVEHGAGMVG